jgi:hypothetical protein
LRLLDFIKEKRALFDPREPQLFAHAVALYESELGANARMKPSSKHYRRICIRKLQTTWPRLWGNRLLQIDEED